MRILSALRHIRNVMSRLTHISGRSVDQVALPITAVKRTRWQSRAQEDEFLFHKSNEWRQSQDFMAQTERLFRYFNFSGDSFRAKCIIDVGAGSRLRSKFFVGAYLIAIEPLANRFTSEIEWCDLNDADELYAAPAEERIEACLQRADLVISINVLDHCFDFSRVIRNIRDYLKPEGLAFLSFDEHWEPDTAHPLVLTEESCRETFERIGLRIDRSSTGLGPCVGGQQTYGHGAHALNFWLSRADSLVGSSQQAGSGP